MREDSENRFNSIMDKLFHSPRTITKASSSHPSSSSGLQTLRGKKQPNPTPALALLDPNSGLDNVEEVQPSASMSQVLLCRPWQCGDLIRRLSTFKSMTWFAKPKVSMFGLEQLITAWSWIPSDDTDIFVHGLCQLVV